MLLPLDFLVEDLIGGDFSGQGTGEYTLMNLKSVEEIGIAVELDGKLLFGDDL